MFNKKAVSDLPYYILPLIIFFIIILGFFGVLFFSEGIMNSPKLIISSESYQDSSNLITIMKSVTNVQQNNQNLTIAQLISLTSKDQTYKTQLSAELNLLLKNLPIPPRGKTLSDVTIATPESTRETLKTFSWNLDILIDQTNLIHLGTMSSFSTNYSIQSMTIPLQNNKLAKVDLYLNCFGCKKGDIDAIS